MPAVLPSGGDGGHRQLRGGQHVAHAQRAAVNGLQHQQAGHNLGQAGGGTPFVDIALIQNLIRVRVNEQGGLGLNFKGAVLLFGGQSGGGKGKRQEQREKKRAKTANFHIILQKNMVY